MENLWHGMTFGLFIYSRKEKQRSGERACRFVLKSLFLLFVDSINYWYENRDESIN
jgi:hypothetical protein